MKFVRQVLYSVFAVMALSAPAISASSIACPNAAELTPAMLVESPRNASLVSELAESWSGRDRYNALQFEAYVTRSGELRGLRFTRPPVFRQSERRRLTRNVRKLDIRPAQDGDDPLTVYVTFSLIAVDVDGRSESFLVMNNLAHVDEYGLFYVSPQRIRGSAIWPRRNRSEWHFVGVQVGVDGKVESVLNDTEQLEEQTSVRRIAEDISKACFVPGSVNGSPREMSYTERFDGAHLLR